MTGAPAGRDAAPHRLHDLALLGDRKAFFEDNLATLSTSTPISEHVRVGAVTD
jgi:hypothetical protein